MSVMDSTSAVRAHSLLVKWPASRHAAHDDVWHVLSPARDESLDVNAAMVVGVVHEVLR